MTMDEQLIKGMVEKLQVVNAHIQALETTLEHHETEVRATKDNLEDQRRLRNALHDALRVLGVEDGKVLEPLVPA